MIENFNPSIIGNVIHTHAHIYKEYELLRPSLCFSIQANRASRIAPFDEFSFLLQMSLWLSPFSSIIRASIFHSHRLHPADGDPRSPGAQSLPGRSPLLISIPTEQHLLERLAEDLIEDGIEDRVDHGTGIAEPGDQVEDLAVDMTLAVGTYGRH